MIEYEVLEAKIGDVSKYGDTWGVSYKKIKELCVNGTTTLNSKRDNVGVALNGKKHPYSFRLYLYDELNQNCQISSIGNFYKILSSWFTKEEKIEILKKVHEVRNTKTNMTLIDVDQKFESHIDELIPKENITFKQKYTSTRGTNMMMVLYKNKGFIFE